MTKIAFFEILRDISSIFIITPKTILMHNVELEQLLSSLQAKAYLFTTFLETLNPIISKTK